MLNLHLLECTLKGYDHISDLLLAKYWVITGCKYGNCENIIELNIGNEVAIISEGAFTSCDKLDKIILGKGLEKVEDKAFNYTNPKEVYCNATTPPSIVSSTNFNKIDKTTSKLYVPKGTYSAYYLSNWGSIFTNIIEMDWLWIKM